MIARTPRVGLGILALLSLLTSALLAGAPAERAAGVLSSPAAHPPADRTASSPVPTFRRGTLGVTLTAPTSLTFGPDGRLYVASSPQTGPEGAIHALTLNATKQVVALEPVATGLEDVMGIAFDPTAPASPPAIYASRRVRANTDGLESVITRYSFTGFGWTAEDVITGLPTSRPGFNHLTNGLAFDGAGRLYIAQGSATDAGLPGASPWPETPLSAAILVADVNALGFDGAVTYSPAGPPADDNVDQVSGDVQVFASGLRNPFDLVVHSNGHLYATDNGPSGPNYSATCSTTGTGVSFSDELNLIELGNYYGHPNRNRGRADPRQCAYHQPEEGSGADFTGPIAILPQHCSCDGIAEYTAALFGGVMQGDLVYAEFQRGNVTRAKLALDGRSLASAPAVLASGFTNPLDVTVGPDGTIYIAEFLGQRISYLAPDSDRDGCADFREEQAGPVQGGNRDPKLFWDFFDTPDPQAPAGGPDYQRNHVIGLEDVLRVAARFGATGKASGDPLSDPPKTGYHTAYDRTPPGDPKLIGPADGAIQLGDVLAAAAQFGHNCA